jgi:5-methylcytosine-specific restriction enzyme A
MHAQSWQWKKLAKAIKERDHYECQINGPHCIGNATTVDHIQPVSKRPDLADDPTNLRAACRPCNNHKGHTSDRRQPPPDRR